MSHYSTQSDPDDNPQFRRDWGDGPVYINFNAKKAKPAIRAGKAARRSTILTPAPRADVRAP